MSKLSPSTSRLVDRKVLEQLKKHSKKKSPKIKTLCDWKREEIEEQLDVLRLIVENPEFVCRKCARAAATPKALCKAKPLNS